MCQISFIPIEACICVLGRILQSVRKEEAEEEKNKEKKPQNLASRLSEMAGVIFFKFGLLTSLPSWHFCSKFGVNRIRECRATKV